MNTIPKTIFAAAALAVAMGVQAPAFGQGVLFVKDNTVGLGTDATTSSVTNESNSIPRADEGPGDITFEPGEPQPGPDPEG